jgi:hypothetical protein
MATRQPLQQGARSNGKLATRRHAMRSDSGALGSVADVVVKIVEDLIRLVKCVVVSAVLLDVGLSLGVLHAAQARTIDRERRVSIAARLLPDDRLVVVRDFQPDLALLNVPDHLLTRSEWVEDALKPSEAVVRFELAGLAAAVTKDGTWIETKLSGRVSQVLYSRSKLQVLKTGTPVTINFFLGGTARIGDCEARAGALPNMKRDRSFLMFLGTNDDGDLIPERTIFEIKNGLLVDTFRPLKVPGDREPLEGQSLQQVRAEIDRAAPEINRLFDQLKRKN